MVLIHRKVGFTCKNFSRMLREGWEVGTSTVIHCILYIRTLLCSINYCSGGRDLSGNKRTNKEQSFDQKFDKMNEALRVSCRQGYPVRVVR